MSSTFGCAREGSGSHTTVSRASAGGDEAELAETRPGGIVRGEGTARRDSGTRKPQIGSTPAATSFPLFSSTGVKRSRVPWSSRGGSSLRTALLTGLRATRPGAVASRSSGTSSAWPNRSMIATWVSMNWPARIPSNDDVVFSPTSGAVACPGCGARGYWPSRSFVTGSSGGGLGADRGSRFASRVVSPSRRWERKSQRLTVSSSWRRAALSGSLPMRSSSRDANVSVKPGVRSVRPDGLNVARGGRLLAGEGEVASVEGPLGAAAVLREGKVVPLDLPFQVEREPRLLPRRLQEIRFRDGGRERLVARDRAPEEDELGEQRLDGRQALRGDRRSLRPAPPEIAPGGVAAREGVRVGREVAADPRDEEDRVVRRVEAGRQAGDELTCGLQALSRGVVVGACPRKVRAGAGGSPGFGWSSVRSALILPARLFGLVSSSAAAKPSSVTATGA